MIAKTDNNNATCYAFRRILISVVNLMYLGVWVFLVSFGAAKDATQLGNPDMHVSCFSSQRSSDDDDVSCDDDYPYLYARSSSSTLTWCCTSRPYNPAYKILHVIGGALGFFQMFYYAAHLLYRGVYSAVDFVFLFESQVKTLLWITPSITMMFVYQYLVYDVMFCGYDAEFCLHESRASTVMDKVFRSMLAFAVVFFVLQVFSVGSFLWTFETKRRKTWNRITLIEGSLFVHDRVKEALEAQNDVLLDTTSAWDIKSFLDYWMHRRDDDIIRALPEKSESVMSALKSEMSGDDRDRIIYRQDFDAYCAHKRVPDAQTTWDTLTLEGTYDCISRDGVEDVLYELFFRRKQLAYAIHSDLAIGNTIYAYASFTLYPGCFIVVAKIFEYRDAFGEGIDLFKTYAVIVSYIYSRLMTNLQFLLLMLVERPFNIGDVIEIDGFTYSVEGFTTSHTSLVGSTKLTVSNQRLISDKVVNLTRHKVQDFFDIVFPLSCAYEAQDMLESMRRYGEIYQRDVYDSSIRCEWVRVDASGKTLRCVWRYKFTVMDRSRLLATRTRVANHLVASCEGNLARVNIADQLASGGGLNDAAHLVRLAREEWEKKVA